MLAAGVGVERNLEGAAHYFLLAADQDYAPGQFHLGMAFASGAGVRRNEVTAAKWLTKAANQGYAEAQYQLGKMCASGAGTLKDAVEAYCWLNLAAAQGHEKSAEERDALGIGMLPEQVADANKMARLFFPQHSACTSDNYAHLNLASLKGR
jgi:hypothetical protein